jgi:hypothetical protein
MASEQTQGNETLLAVRETVIFEGERQALKNACSIYKVKAMGFDVRCPYRL